MPVNEKESSFLRVLCPGGFSLNFIGQDYIIWTCLAARESGKVSIRREGVCLSGFLRPIFILYPRLATLPSPSKNGVLLERKKNREMNVGWSTKYVCQRIKMWLRYESSKMSCWVIFLNECLSGLSDLEQERYFTLLWDELWGVHSQFWPFIPGVEWVEERGCFLVLPVKSTIG